MTVLLCPLCSQPRFSNLESLRLSLVNAATQSITCPICNDILMGLDKLTIHLFGHTLNQNLELGQRPSMELKTSSVINDPSSKSNVQEEYQVRSTESGNNFEIEFDETEKLEESTEKFFTDIETGYCHEGGEKILHEESEIRNDNLCTVNMEDLSFLTSWESSVKTKQDEKELNSYNQSNDKPESNDLSQYMSDLLNKKLPILNSTLTLDSSTDSIENSQEIEKNETKCKICNFSFPNPMILSMHEELVHAKAKIKKFEIETHVDDHIKEPTVKIPQVAEEKTEFLQELVCVSTISEDVKTVDLMNNSATVVRNEGNDMVESILPRYDCHICSKSFKMKGSLLLHFRVAHFGLGSSEPLQIIGDLTSSEERNYSCPICNKTFKKEQHLTQHIKTHEGKQWQCETCYKHFTTKYFLKKHQRLHTGEMPYSCITCKKTFTFQQSYHKHLLYHSDEKPHQCNQCGRSFKELSTLHNHQRIHSGEKPFACETCGKCFRQRVSYIVHQRIHTGVLPYQCTACKKKFRYKVSQRSHKCTAQPPGIVIRQPDIVQKILENNHILQHNPV